MISDQAPPNVQEVLDHFEGHTAPPADQITAAQREQAIHFALRMLNRAGVKATVQAAKNGNLMVTIRRPWAKPPKKGKKPKDGNGGRYRV